METPAIYPITDLRQDATNLIGRVCDSGQPVYITQRGRASAVLLSMETWEQTQRELELLRLFARGEQESTAGVGSTLADVLAKADALLIGKGL